MKDVMVYGLRSAKQLAMALAQQLEALETVISQAPGDELTDEEKKQFKQVLGGAQARTRRHFMEKTDGPQEAGTQGGVGRKPRPG